MVTSSLRAWDLLVTDKQVFLASKPPREIPSKAASASLHQKTSLCCAVLCLRQWEHRKGWGMGLMLAAVGLVVPQTQWNQLQAAFKPCAGAETHHTY